MPPVPAGHAQAGAAAALGALPVQGAAGVAGAVGAARAGPTGIAHAGPEIAVSHLVRLISSPKNI